MRLSFTKRWCLILALLLVVAVFCAMGVCLVAAPSLTASADNTELQLKGFTLLAALQYGDKLHDLVDENGRIYGSILNNVFDLDAPGEYYIRAVDIQASTSTAHLTTKSICNSAGLVQLDVRADYDAENPNSGLYYLSYKDGGFNTFFVPLRVYKMVGEIETEMPYVVTTTLVNTPLQCQVIPREIEVAYNAESSWVGTGGLSGLNKTPLTTEIVDGVMYIQRTYGAEMDTIAFSESAGSKKVMAAFGDALTTQGRIVGNDDTTHVGYNEIQSLDLVVKRGPDDVSRNYRITSARAGEEGAQYTGYGVQILPREIQIASFQKNSKFTADVPAFDVSFDGHDFSTQAFYQDAPSSGVLGQTVTVYYDVVVSPESLLAGLWDIDADNAPREGVVAITDTDEYWTLSIVGWTVDSTDSEHMPTPADYSVVPAAEATFLLQVSARPIVLYDATYTEAGTEGEWVDVVANDIAISQPYGELYDKNARTHSPIINGTRVTLSFEVQYEGQALSDYLTANGLDEIRLPAGVYPIINPSVKDSHYSVTVHESVRWTVTKRELSYAQLKGSIADSYYANANGSAQQRDMYRYLHGYAESEEGIRIKEFDYDMQRTVINTTLDIAVSDGELQESVQQAVSVTACNPGYYEIHFENDNYAIADGVLYVRVKPVRVILNMPESPTYDATAKEASVDYEGQTSNPFDGWTVSISYRAESKTVSPVNAGTYTVVVDVSGPDASFADNPYLVYTGTNERFTIAPASVTVTLTGRARTSKTFGENITVSGNWYTASLFGSDKVALASAGFAASAVPGKSYDITASVSKGTAGNYNLILRGADGKLNPKIRVDKLSADVAKTYFDGVMENMAITTGIDSITLPAIRYNDLAITGVNYRISAGDDKWIDVDNATASDLADGTKYKVQIIIRGGGAYVDTTQDIVTIVREAVTDIARPVVSQDMDYSSGRSVFAVVENFDATKTYMCVAYIAEQGAQPTNVQEKAILANTTDGRISLVHYYSLKQAADDSWQLDARNEMYECGVYEMVVVVSTDDYAVMSEPLTVRTRIAAPTLAPTALTVTSDTVDLPSGYYIYITEADYNSALPVAAVLSVSMQEAGITYAMLAESGASLDDAYIASVTEGLASNTAYVVAIWSKAEDNLPSDVQCFLFKTRIDERNRFRYTGAMLLFSRYILVGMLGLNIILLIVCAVRYAALKKKLGR